MTLELWLVIAAGAIAVAYGVVTTQSLMAMSAGSDRMKEIAAAIQEGANAYLNRQYTTIAMVGAVVAVVIFFTLGWTSALGFGEQGIRLVHVFRHVSDAVNIGAKFGGFFLLDQPDAR